jgi:predicted RNase H-like HicB family nuclease
MDRIRVIYEQDEDTWVATSPEVPNWTVVADSCEEAHRLAEEGVRFALDRDDVELKHFRSGIRCLGHLSRVREGYIRNGSKEFGRPSLD